MGKRVYETSEDGRTGWSDQGYEGGRLDRTRVAETSLGCCLQGPIFY